MKVLGLTLDGATKNPVLVLQQEDGKELLPIWLGATEAMAVSMALNQINLPRPLSHTLLLRTLNALGGKLIGLTINELRQGTFYACLEIVNKDNVFIQVDCRPSDGITLALRAEAPIHVVDEVLHKATEDRLNPMCTLEERCPMDASDKLIRQSMPQDAFIQTDPPVVPAAETCDRMDDKHLTELLQRLEPASKRVM